MKHIILINANIRKEDSRTLKLTNLVLDNFKDKVEIEEINLSELDLKPHTNFDNPYLKIEDRFFDYSRKLANSDGIIISTPFWDMSFPSLLKVFLEKLSISDIMFKDDGTTCVGIAKCPFMFYLTTRGMNIEDGSKLDQASPYLEALCELWGIKDFDFIGVSNCDYLSSEEVDRKIVKASKEGINKLKALINK